VGSGRSGGAVLKAKSPAEWLVELTTRTGAVEAGMREAELVTRIREDLKAATKAGLFPIGTRFLVARNRGRYYSPCGSITVSLNAWPGAVFTAAYQEYVLDGADIDPGSGCSVVVDQLPASYRPREYAPEYTAALEIAKAIADRHNYDHGDVQGDLRVGYYLSVVAPVVHEAEAGLRREREEQLAARPEVVSP
jgi:hypothetical protein